MVNFWQIPNGHLSGQGCPKCRNEANGERCRSSKEEFITMAREVHGDKYDYSKVKYIGAHTKVCIIVVSLNMVSFGKHQVLI